MMRMLAEFFPEFAEKLDEIDKMYAEKRMIDEKTYQFICFALSIKARSKPWNVQLKRISTSYIEFLYERMTKFCRR